jgi:predicted phosphohydrolase
MSHRGKKPPRVLVAVTHEPPVPQNWPDGHVAVVLTRNELDECVEVTIHGVRHYLHSTTARELSNKLLGRIEEWNTIAQAAGVPEV